MESLNERNHSNFIADEERRALLNNKNVSDLVFRFEAKNEAHLRELLSSPQFRQQMEYFYHQNDDPGARNLLKNRRYLRNDSQLSLTDSEFFSDDQQTSPTMPHKEDLTRLGRFLNMISHLPLPRMSVTGMGICFLLAIFICPRAAGENLIFPAFRLLFGTLYPAYSSYKAVRTRNVKEYVKWMMYWIVFAFFTFIETFTDLFLSWFPFYYEVKVLVVIWLLSPATKGSSTLYKKFVHPMLTRNEQEIDEYINQAKEKGYTAVLQLGSKGVNYATNVLMRTALKGGGNLVQTIRRSYSLSDLSEPDVHRTQDQTDEVVSRPQRILRPRSQTVRSSSGGRQVEMYFSEVDVPPKNTSQKDYNYIRSSEDISSGYSSAEPISVALSRTSSMTNASRTRLKSKKAEENFYLENADCEQTRLQNPNPCPNSYVSVNLNSIPALSQPKLITSKEIQLNEENLRELRDQTFFENEKFFQENLENLENVSGEITPQFTIFTKDNVKPDDAEKYKLFCKWLEDSERELRSKSERIEAVVLDEFQDTISSESESEDYVDTERYEGDAASEFLETPTLDLKIIQTEITNFATKTNTPESVNPVENPAIPTENPAFFDNVLNERFSDEILSANLSNSDSSISKRPASHNKGKAPEPPLKNILDDLSQYLKGADLKGEKNALIVHPPSPPPPPPTPRILTQELLSPYKNSERAVSPPHLDKAVRKDYANDVDTSHPSQSRSPSPKPDSKKHKKGFLKNYLPSIFRPESPKSLSSSSHDDFLKETQI